MRSLFVIVVLACLGVACSSPKILEIPQFPNFPDYWVGLSSTTIPGSDCPFIEGEYLEPPLIHRQGGDSKYFPKDDKWLYFGYIPFHLANRREFTSSEHSPRKNNFLIRQPDATQFYFLFLNDQETAISEYNFRSDEGDFKCDGGRIEFPRITRYGVIEGASVNFQIKNVLLKDEEGALVIQSTGGPYRGKTSQESKKFMFEFIKYLPKND